MAIMTIQLLFIFYQNEQRLERIPVMEARRGCDEITHSLKLVESSIRGLFSDVQALKDGRYHQAEQMYRRYGIAWKTATLSQYGCVVNFSLNNVQKGGIKQHFIAQY